MTDDSYLLDNKDKKPKTGSKWLSRLFKLIFFILAFGLIILTVLYNMGGSNDMLKEGVVNTLSDVFGGRHVKLRRLNHMGFFPQVALNIEGVSAYDKKDGRVPVIELRKFEAYMPFWNVATRSPQISSLYMEGLKGIKGVFFPEEVYLEKVYIDHDVDEGTASLRGNGTVGVHDWSFAVGLDIEGSSGRYKYGLAEVAPVVFDLGDVHFDANVRKDGSNYMKISDIHLTYADKKIEGDVTLSALPGSLLKIKGELLANGGSTILVPDLIVSMVGSQFADFSGSISAKKFVMDDLSGDKSVFEILNRFNELLGYKRVPGQKTDKLALFGGNNFNVDITLENAQIAEMTKDKIAFNVSQSAGNLRVSKVQADEEDIMPPVILLYDYQAEKVISIFQNGHFDSSVMKLWLKHIPAPVLQKGYIDIECGLGMFHQAENGLIVEDFAINTTDGNHVGIQETQLTEGLSAADLHFVQVNGKADLPEYELPGDLYNLVMGSFEKSKDGSPCANYFKKAPEQVDGPKVDAEDVRRDIQ